MNDEKYTVRPYKPKTDHRDIEIERMRRALIDVQFCGEVTCSECLKTIKKALGEQS